MSVDSSQSSAATGDGSNAEEAYEFATPRMRGPRIALAGIVTFYLGAMLLYLASASWNLSVVGVAIAFLVTGFITSILGGRIKLHDIVWSRIHNKGLTILHPPRKRAVVEWNNIVEIKKDDQNGTSLVTILFRSSRAKNSSLSLDGSVTSRAGLRFVDILEYKYKQARGETGYLRPQNSPIAGTNHAAEIGIPFTRKLFQLRSLEPRFRFLTGLVLAQIVISSIAVSLPAFGEAQSVDINFLGRFSITNGHLLLSKISAVVSLLLLIFGLYKLSSKGKNLLLAMIGIAFTAIFFSVPMMIMVFENAGIDVSSLFFVPTPGQVYNELPAFVAITLMPFVAVILFRRLAPRATEAFLYLWIGYGLIAAMFILLAGENLSERAAVSIALAAFVLISITGIIRTKRWLPNIEAYGYWLWSLSTAIAITTAWLLDWTFDNTMFVIVLYSISGAAAFGVRSIIASPSARSKYLKVNVSFVMAMLVTLVGVLAYSDPKSDLHDLPVLLLFAVGLFWILCIQGMMYARHRRVDWLAVPWILIFPGLILINAISGADVWHPVNWSTLVPYLALIATTGLLFVGVDWGEISDSLSRSLAKKFENNALRARLFGMTIVLFSCVAAPTLLNGNDLEEFLVSITEATTYLICIVAITILALRYSNFRCVHTPHITLASLITTFFLLGFFMPHGIAVFALSILALICCCRGEYERFSTLALFWMFVGALKISISNEVPGGIGNPEMFASLLDSYLATIGQATATIGVMSTLTLLCLALVRSRMRNVETLLSNIFTLNLSLLALYALAKFVYVPASHIGETSAIIGAIVLFISLFWDVITSGQSITSTEGTIFSKSSRLSFFLAYILSIVTVVVLLKHARHLGSTDHNRFAEVLPFMLSALRDPEFVVMFGIANFGVPMVLTFFTLRCIRWHLMRRQELSPN